MAKLTVEYLVVKPGRGGTKRYFWQPAKALRAFGWQPQRIPDDWESIADPGRLEAAAFAKARALNAELAAWRKGQVLPPSALGVAPPQAKTTLQPGSFAAVVASYKLSRFFTKTKPKTKRAYGQSLAVLEAWTTKDGVSSPVRAITPKSIETFYTALHAKTPAVANNAVRMLSTVMKHALRENLITVNPAANPGLIASDPSGLIWPAAAVALIVRTADALGYHGIGTAIVLNNWLGQREGDILKLRRGAMRRQGDLAVIQGKGGYGVSLPIAMVKPLVDRIDAELARHDAARPGIVQLEARRLPLIVNEATGLAYNEHTFRHEFAEIRAKAAKEIPVFEVDYAASGFGDDDDDAFTVRTADLLFMHLRHTAIVRLAEAGATIPEIAGVSGHTLGSVTQILERYMVRTGELARQAFAKRLAKEQADG